MQNSGRLQAEINILKLAISQLLGLPAGINVDVDKQLSNLKSALNTNQDCKTIQQRVELLILVLVAAVSNLKQTKISRCGNMGEFIQQGAGILNPLIGKLNNLNTVNVEQLFANDMDESQQMARFIQLLGTCVAAVEKKIGLTQQNYMQPSESKTSDNGEASALVMSQDINQRLKQLIEHLSIPDEYYQKLHLFKTILEEAITGEKLTLVIDQLTELIVDAFNLEQNYFKGFLQDLTSQLRNFDTYLQFAHEQNQESQNDSQQLESGIQSNIQEIQQHIYSSTTIEELSRKINQNLTAIGERIKTYKSNEQKRFDAYQEKVDILQEKLMESERNAEVTQSKLYFQQEKINQDSLTSLPNRGAYDEHISKAYQRYQRGFGDLSLAIADIDYFKTINDNYGHLAGDKVLKKVASIFKNAIRNVDFIARYGGEEFVFVFERTSEEQARKILESLRFAIEKCQFCYRDNNVKVTVSLGLTTARPADTLESFFMRADAAMYRAKCGGRNRVEC